jgi:hypothetical protein
MWIADIIVENCAAALALRACALVKHVVHRVSFTAQQQYSFKEEYSVSLRNRNEMIANWRERIGSRSSCSVRLGGRKLKDACRGSLGQSHSASRPLAAAPHPRAVGAELASFSQCRTVYNEWRYHQIARALPSISSIQHHPWRRHPALEADPKRANVECPDSFVSKVVGTTDQNLSRLVFAHPN